jgi:hypothetical protein
VLNEPDTGGTVNTFDQQVYISLFTQVIDELFLYLVQIIEGEPLGDFRRWGETAILRRTLVESIQSRGIDRLADGFASQAAEVLRFALYLGDDILFGWNRQTAVKTDFPTVCLPSIDLC